MVWLAGLNSQSYDSQGSAACRAWNESRMSLLECLHMRMNSCRRPWLKPWFACGFSLCVLGQVWHGEEAMAQSQQQQQQQDQYRVESPALSADSQTLTISKSEDGSG